MVPVAEKTGINGGQFMENASPFTSELPRKQNHKEIMRAVCKVLDDMEDGTKFSGSQLPRMVAAIEPKCEHTEGETIRRYMRYWRDRGNGRIVCIDRCNSIYQKMPKEA